MDACVLGGVYTDVEQTMIELERAPSVRDTRSAFQNAMKHKFIREVERLSGRTVLTFISDSHVGPDVRSSCSCLRLRLDSQGARRFKLCDLFDDCSVMGVA